jgi:hypothetical protein
MFSGQSTLAASKIRNSPTKVPAPITSSTTDRPWKIQTRGRPSRALSYNKGGGFRKWFGLNESVIDWENEGKAIKSIPTAVVANEGFFFRSGLTWSTITVKKFSIRWFGPGFIFDNGGCCLFSDESIRLYLLALINSIVFEAVLEKINPTLNFQSGEVAKFPTLIDSRIRREIDDLTSVCVELARIDWDNFETSWNFRDQPLLREGTKSITLAASWEAWRNQCDAAICQMRELETQNNRLFISAYRLADELEPEVPEQQITLARADARRDVVAFLSYAVGCMMGRYSLDRPGLILANTGGTLRQYFSRVQLPQDQLTFAPDVNGIIPVLDGEWFEDDIVAQLRHFLRVVFGRSTLRENIGFIEVSLGRELRNYFLTDFYKDHLQTYKKRPIYWMVQSPRKGFSVLIYLHRYTKDTMNLVLSRYLRDYQVKLRNRLGHVTQVQAAAPTARDKTAARQDADKLKKTLCECEVWERKILLPLAQARIELDLDGGVKTNYLKLGEALAPIAGLAATDEE